MDKDKEREWRSIVGELAQETSEVGTSLHHLFTEMRKGGFTEDQSLRIIAYGMFHQPNNNEDN